MASRPLPLVPLALLGLLGCAAQAPDDLAQGSPGASPRPPAAVDDAPPLPAPSDLIALPSPGAALSQVPIGRLDPFAPLEGPRSGPPPITLPAGFQLRGVLRVAGRDQAFVQSASGSGVICLGPRGRCSAGSEPLLPRGTRVLAIQPRLGCITIAVAAQRQRHCLQGS